MEFYITARGCEVGFSPRGGGPRGRRRVEVSERHACRLLAQWRRTQRYAAPQRTDENALTEAIIAMASEYQPSAECGRFG
jgi:hypothetical protein